MIPTMRPLELQQTDTAFDHPDWIFELKYDGFRALAQIERGACQLVSRNGNVFKRFDDLRQALPNDLKGVVDVVLDGEIVVLDESGASQFNELMRSRSATALAVFDVLWLNGEDLREMPLLERKRILHSVIRPKVTRVLYVDHVVHSGRALYREICRRNLEGVVAKPGVSPYRKVLGRSPWLKIKNPNYAQAEGRGDLFDRQR